MLYPTRIRYSPFVVTIIVLLDASSRFFVAFNVVQLIIRVFLIQHTAWITEVVRLQNNTRRIKRIESHYPISTLLSSTTYVTSCSFGYCKNETVSVTSLLMVEHGQQNHRI
jgi:hypothetical protein